MGEGSNSTSYILQGRIKIFLYCGCQKSEERKNKSGKMKGGEEIISATILVYIYLPCLLDPPATREVP